MTDLFLGVFSDMDEISRFRAPTGTDTHALDTLSKALAKFPKFAKLYPRYITRRRMTHWDELRLLRVSKHVRM